MRADDGRAVSARRYNAFSGMLDGESKRLHAALRYAADSVGHEVIVLPHTG